MYTHSLDDDALSRTYGPQHSGSPVHWMHGTRTAEEAIPRKQGALYPEPIAAFITLQLISALELLLRCDCGLYDALLRKDRNL